MGKIHIYTDGAAKGNPGPGGYGIVLLFNGQKKEMSEGFRLTTNNRMELMAVIRALQALKTTAHQVEIFSDSKYVIDSITKGWVFGWRQKGYKGKKNKDLWEEYIPLHQKFKPEFHWVKGHAGNPMNERCDTLAVMAAELRQLNIDENYEREQREEKRLL